MDNKPNPDDKKKALQILGPAAAVAAVVVLIGVFVSIGGSPSATTGKGTPPGSQNKTAATMAGQFNFALEGADWKDIGEGLKVWDVKEGTGDPCPAQAKVQVHYAGFLTDGKKFDSSLDRGEPIEFGLNGVIPGWTRGIPGMKAGGIRRLFIPSVLGYGSRGTQGIPGNSDLVFEVEMLSFK